MLCILTIPARIQIYFVQSEPFVQCMPEQIFEVYEVYQGPGPSDAKSSKLVMTYEVPPKQSGCKVGIEKCAAPICWNFPTALSFFFFSQFIQIKDDEDEDEPEGFVYKTGYHALPANDRST